MNEVYINDDLRMVRSDDRNIALEQLSHGINQRTKKQTISWRVVGYFRTFNMALNHVIDKDLLIDESQVKDLQSYLNEVKRVRDDISELVKERWQ